MGYTHYYYTTTFTKKNWKLILNDVRKLAENLPPEIKLTGCSKYGWYPHFGDDEIWFNGDPDHETFVLYRKSPEPQGYLEDRSRYFNFCKTARKPYDLMVCAVLLVAQHHAPKSIRVSSDGGPEDWQEAEEFVKNTLGYEEKFREEED